MRDAVPSAARIDVLVNTHANGDHCYGNELVRGARDRGVGGVRGGVGRGAAGGARRS